VSETPPGPGPGFWYLAGPYSVDPTRLVWVHRRSAALLFRAGLRLYSPICSWHEVAAHYDLPGDAAFWAVVNHGMIDRAEGLIVLVMEETPQSQGTRAELAHAEVQGKPVWGLEPPESLVFHWRRLR